MRLSLRDLLVFVALVAVATVSLTYASTRWRLSIVSLRIGHCWWALLLSYFGGLFASSVYARRLKAETSSTK